MALGDTSLGAVGLLIHQAITTGVLAGRHCAEELTTHPGEKVTCHLSAGHADDHTDRHRAISW